MRRILLGPFGEVLGRAIRRLLDEVPGHFVVTSADRVTLRVLEDVRPDVVIVNLDDRPILSEVVELSRGFPRMAVVACSAEEPLMMVFPAFHDGHSYLLKLTSGGFASAVSADPWNAMVPDAAERRLAAINQDWDRPSTP